MKKTLVNSIVATINSTCASISSIEIQDKDNKLYTLEQYMSDDSINARNLCCYFKSVDSVIAKRFSVFASFVRFNQVYEHACSIISADRKKQKDNFFVANLSDTQTLEQVLIALQCAHYDRLSACASIKSVCVACEYDDIESTSASEKVAQIAK